MRRLLGARGTTCRFYILSLLLRASAAPAELRDASRHCPGCRLHAGDRPPHGSGVPAALASQTKRALFQKFESKNIQSALFRAYQEPLVPQKSRR